MKKIILLEFEINKNVRVDWNKYFMNLRKNAHIYRNVTDYLSQTCNKAKSLKSNFKLKYKTVLIYRNSIYTSFCNNA